MSDVNLDPASNYYCMSCYEVVPVGQFADHREEVHDGDMMVDIVSIRKSGDDLIAQEDGMGHFTPHVWMDVDDHEMCGECRAVKVKPEDVPGGDADE